MDLRSFTGGETMGDDDATQGYYRLLRGEITVPVVAAVNGAALAAGSSSSSGAM